MDKRLLAQEPFLRSLTRSSPKRRKLLLQQATKDELTVLFEICLNILKGNIPLNNTAFKKLKRHKRILRTLGSKKMALTHKENLVNQKGGAIGTVVEMIASLVLHLLDRLMK